MNKLTVAGLVVAVMTAAATAQDQEQYQLPQPTEEHAWLKQLVGKWDAEIEAFMGPDAEPMKMKGTQSVRMVGGFWSVAENKGEFQGQPFNGIMTLGYDAKKKHYIGTWVDSMTDHMWQYTGKVDKTGKKLTLETTGPNHAGGTSKFKETIEIKSKDHKLFTSMIQTDDGEWFTMMRINYKRKK